MALSDYEKEIVKSIQEQGGTRGDVVSMLNKYRANKREEYVWGSQSIGQQAQALVEKPLPQFQPQKTDDRTITEKVWQWAINLFWWAVSNIPEQVGNTWQFLYDVLKLWNQVTPIWPVLNMADKKLQSLWLQSIWDAFQKAGIKSKEALQDLFWVEEEALWTKIWEFTWDVVATLTPTPAGKVKIAETVLQKFPKAWKLLEWVLNQGTKWAIEMWKYDIVSEWDVSPQDVAIWAMVNPVLAGISKGVKGVINKFSWARTTEQVAWNILQPTWKYWAINFEWAKEWLASTINKLWKSEIKDINDYKALLSTIKKQQNETFAPLNEWLSKISWTYTNDSVTDALSGLLWVLNKQPWQKYKDITTEVVKLINKNNTTGLTLPEIQRVKILHTQNNRLFTDTGKEASWVSSDALREVRKDIKEFIENEAKKQWFSDVASINTQYSNLLDAQSLIESQILRLTNFVWREWKQSFLQNVAEFATELPWVKQAITQPLQTVFWKVFRTLRAWKVNPIEVEKQLPQLIKELKSIWMPEKAINETLQNIINTVKLIWTWEGINSLLD